MTVKAIIAALPLLASCASSGLYNMSDDWCKIHATATAARCSDNHQDRTASGSSVVTVSAVTRVE